MQPEAHQPNADSATNITAEEIEQVLPAGLSDEERDIVAKLAQSFSGNATSAEEAVTKALEARAEATKDLPGERPYVVNERGLVQMGDEGASEREVARRALEGD